MNKVLLSLGLAVLLAGCDKPAQNGMPENNLPERQVQHEPADSSTPIVSINTDSPSMPKTSSNPSPTPQQDGDDAKSHLDLQATMITPTNQVVISSEDEAKRATPGKPASTDQQVTNENPATPNKPKADPAAK